MIDRVLTMLALIAFATPSVAKTPQSETAGPNALDPLIACRSISEASARLACYDRSVEALQASAARHDIVVVDRAEVRTARRSLFGFTLPSLKIFGGGEDGDGNPARTPPADDIREINATVRGASEDGMGNWAVTLDDGAVWHQTDGQIGRSPRAGDEVLIRRGALGSYFMRIGKQPGVKARRER